MKYLLTLNAGSSSLKYALFTDALSLVEEGKVAKDELKTLFSRLPEISRIGHRVVHGGDRYTKTTKIDQRLIEELKDLIELAPLHNKIAVEVIEECISYFGKELFQLAVFDTTFFRQMPEHARFYALAKKYGIKRYGFHGIAHEALWQAYLQMGGKTTAKIITLQLGSGSSIAAIDSGRPLDTSMGYTPNEGLVMATRTGDIDPQVVVELAKTMPLTEAMHVLNYESGLLGLAGTSNMQDINPNDFAVDLYCYRIVKYIGAYIAVLKGIDALIFSGGIGEHASHIRKRIENELSWYQIPEVLVVPSQENLFIAKELINPKYLGFSR